MPYPSAPWKLQGYAFVALQLIDINRVRPLIPSELDIISVWPGKTIGGVYLSTYESGSVLEYNELIVVASFVSYKGKFGGWISHIYVDNIDSVAGGREIWGLPKELAEFNWEQKRITVRQSNQLLCTLDYNRQDFGWRQGLAASAFGILGSNLLLFKSEFEAQFGLVSAKLAVPAESPFANLSLGQPLLTVHCDRLSLSVAAPEVVGQIAEPTLYRKTS